MIEYMREHGALLCEQGYSIIPIKPRDKRPAISKWQEGWDTATDPEQADKWRADYGIGILCGRVVAIDIDILDPDLVRRVEQAAEAIFDTSPCRRVGKAPKSLLVYRAAEPLRKSKVSHGQHAVEILAQGQQFVAYGIHPDTGKSYEWFGDDLYNWELAELPAVDAAQVAQFLARASEIIGAPGQPLQAESSREPDSHSGPARSRISVADLRSALEHISPDLPYDEWIRVGMALRTEMDSDGYMLWQQWSETGDKWCGDEACFQHWQSFNNTMISGASIIQLACRDPQYERPIDGELLSSITAMVAARSLPADPQIKPEQLFTKYSDWGAPEPIEWLVDLYIPAAPLTMIYGPTGEGKTFAILDLFLSVAAGADWHGRPTQQRPVFYVAGEGRETINTRVSAWLQDRDQPADIPFYSTQVPVMLPSQAKELFDGIQAHAGPDSRPVVIIDTLAANIDSDIDLNSKAQPFLNTVRKLAAAMNGTAVIVHHTPKRDREEPRNSGEILGSCDSAHCILAEAYDAQERLTKLALIPKKMKGQARPFRLLFELADIQLKMGDGSIQAAGVLRAAGSPAIAVGVEAAKALKGMRGKQIALYKALREHTQAVIDSGGRAIIDFDQIKELAINAGYDSRRIKERATAPFIQKGILMARDDGGFFVDMDALGVHINE